jgi:hypothetical protein
MRGAIRQCNVGRRGAGRLAVLAAALVLFAQSVAVAHYHPRPDDGRASLSTVAGAEAGGSGSVEGHRWKVRATILYLGGNVREFHVRVFGEVGGNAAA